MDNAETVLGVQKASWLAQIPVFLGLCDFP
jgi:hypothetical protein